MTRFAGAPVFHATPAGPVGYHEGLRGHAARGEQGVSMSQKNGDRSRHQINRKRVVVRRAKIRALRAAGQLGTKETAHAKLPPAGKS